MTQKKTILILGARAPVALELCRSLGKKGHQILMADSMNFPLGRWSKYVHEFFILPSPKFFLAQYVDALKKIHEQYFIDFCVPTCEEVFYLSLASSQIPFPVWVEEIELLDKLHNKWSFSQWKNSPFCFPTTRLMSGFEDWDNCEDYVFKPKYSRFGEETLINVSEKKIRAEVGKPEDWIVQEKIDGEELCVYSLWKEGKLLAFSTYKLKCRHRGGAALLFEFLWKEEVYNSIKSFGENIRFTGQLCFDMIQAKEKIYVIECNPRSTSGLHLLAESISLAMVEEHPQIIRNQKQAASLKTAILFSSPFQLLKKEVRQSKDVVFSLTDPKPFFLQMLGLMEFLYRRLRFRISFTQSMTHDISFDGLSD